MSYVAYVLTSTTIGEEESVRRELLKIEGVLRADTTSGAFDNVAVLEGESVDALIDVVTEKVRKIPSVVKTETLIAKKIEAGMGPKEIGEEFKRLEEKIPPSTLKDLKKTVKGKKVTKTQFDTIAGAILEKGEEEIGQVKDEMTKLAKEVEDVEKMVGQKPEKVPVESIRGLEKSVTRIIDTIKTSTSISKNHEKKLKDSLDKIKKKSREISEERLEKVEEQVGELTSIIHGLSKDLSAALGERNLSRFVKETVKKVLKD